MQMLPYRAAGLTEWFDKYENNVNCMLWTSQSQYLKPIQHLLSPPKSFVKKKKKKIHYSRFGESMQKEH